MSSTTGEETRGDFYSQKPGSQDAPSVDASESKRFASSYAKSRQDPTHEVHNNAHYLLARSLVPADTTRSNFIPELAPSHLVDVKWKASTEGAEETAEQVEWVAPGGWNPKIAREVNSILDGRSRLATRYGNQANGSQKSKLHRDQTAQIQIAAATVGYLHDRAADATDYSLKEHLRDDLVGLKGPWVDECRNQSASTYSRIYNSLTGSRGDIFTQAKVNGMIGQIYLREDDHDEEEDAANGQGKTKTVVGEERDSSYGR